MLLYLAAALLAPLAMLVEARFARKKGRTVYEEADTMSNLGQFVGEMILTVTLRLDIFALYESVVAKVAIVHLDPRSPLTWIAAFFALDLLYYVGHRCLHAIGPLWALHTVHHQSTSYNLSVGIRGPWLSAFQTIPFMFPLALLGFPTEVLVPLYAIHTVYKLAVHTEMLASFGPLDALFVSPRMHAVHHALEERYVDKNFGGVLCIWDRLFGTFAEGTPETFGLPDTKAGDPLADNVDPWLAWLGVEARVGTARSRATVGAARVAFVLTSAATLVYMALGHRVALLPRMAIATVLLVSLSFAFRRARPAGSPIA